MSDSAHFFSISTDRGVNSSLHVHVSAAIQDQNKITQAPEKGKTNLRSICLPCNDLSKGELKEGDHGIQNPICQPLLIINRRLALNCLDWSIPVMNSKTNIILMKIYNTKLLQALGSHICCRKRQLYHIYILFCLITCAITQTTLTDDMYRMFCIKHRYQQNIYY